MPRDGAIADGVDAKRLAVDAAMANVGVEAGLRAALDGPLAGARVAVVSSFGAESAALLAIVARVDRTLPVLFIDTEMLFQETMDHQQSIARTLGLTDVRRLRPDAAAIDASDRDGTLHSRNPDACCALRKSAPLDAALKPFDAWVSGRKRHQAATRRGLRPVEIDDAGRLKLNPLWDWSAERLRTFIRAENLPAHPLVAQGYPSIGCRPCTTPVAEGEDPRAGRWRGVEKTECGIHAARNRAVRAAG